MSISEFSRYWGSVFQDPRSQFLAKRVRDELVIAMENACEDRFVMQEKLKKTADSLDIENLLDREMMFGHRRHDCHRRVAQCGRDA